MKKRVLSITVLTVFLISLLSVVSATIILSNPKSNYNLGEDLTIEATINADENANNLFQLILHCSDGEKSFYSETLTLSAGEQKKITKTLTLTDSFLEGMSGICFVNAEYGDEEGKTSNFQISGEIDVSVTLNKKSFEPLDQILIEGNAIKNLGEVSGTVEAYLDGLSLKAISSVSNSKFSLNMSLPESSDSGEYELEIVVYEKDKIGEVSNHGSYTETITVKQIPKKVDVEINKQTLKPGEKAVFEVKLYDQSDKEIEEDVTLEILNSYDEKVVKRLVKTNEPFSLDLEKNAGAGYWKAEVSAFNLESTRLFYIEELEEATFEIVNDTLIVTNIGNVIYRKNIQISIGGELEIKTLDLDVGETRQFRLVAPDGKYDISISDGDNTYSENNVALTGNAIGVLDVRKQLGLITRYPIVWLFIIVIAGLFILMIVERTARKKIAKIGFVPKMFKKKKEGEKEEKKEEKVEHVETANDAHHELVLKGRKEKAGILALKIKNEKLSEKSKKAVEKSLQDFYGKKGKTYRKGKEIIGILTPSLTKTFKNELTAVKVAKEIAKSLEQHNKDEEEKIDFGIGVHSGDIAVKVDKGKLNFTSLGNTLSKAKQLSGKAKADILLSKQAVDKLGSEVRAEKSGEDYKINRIVDREKHKAFIQGFLDRMKGK